MNRQCRASAFLLVFLWAMVGCPAVAAPPMRAEVMLIGVFHFANPKLDSVKSEVIDVMTPQSQS